MTTFEQLLAEKKENEEKINVLKCSMRELELKLDELVENVNEINHNIGELRHVNMNNQTLNLAHTAGKRAYFCEGKICITEYCEKGKEISDMHVGGQEYIEMQIDDFRSEMFKGRFDPHRLYFRNGEVEIIKGTLKTKHGCSDE